jgi:dynein heavy chain
MMLLSPKIFQEPKQLVRAWRNEFLRVFSDRLNTYDDIELMGKHMAEEINKHFAPLDRRSRLPSRSFVSMGVKESLTDMPLNEYVLRDPILFGDYRHGIVDEEERLYEDLLDFGAVMHLFKEIIDEYNDRRGFLDLVLFDDCLDHLTRAHRVLRMFKGHMLLIGIGGCGKHSIVRLAAFAAGCDVFEIVLNRGYNENSFREDLKTLYYKLIETPTVFLFSSAQVSEIVLLFFP